MNLDDEALSSALLGEDELGAVVRAHIHIEKGLLDLIDRMTPYPKYLERLRLSYSQRIDLLLALGMDSEYGPPLKALGKIRNEFAHKPDTVLTDGHMVSMYGTLGPILRGSLMRVLGSILPDDRKGDAREFKKLKPKDRFILIVVALRAMIYAVAMQHKQMRTE